MCFSSQPSAPTNKPDYTPAEAWREHEVSKTDAEGNTSKVEAPQEPAKARTSVPSVKPLNTTLRM